MSTVSTHVLDTAMGRPAAEVCVTLEQRNGDGWERLAAGVTDNDGRVAQLLGAGEELVPGAYRLRFATGAYYELTQTPCFYPTVDIVFAIDAAGDHYHVPLLLSPFGFSTYRGS